MIDHPQVEDRRGRVDHDPAGREPPAVRTDAREGLSLKRVGAVVASRFLVMALLLTAVGVVLTYFGPFASIRGWDLSVNQSLADSRSARYRELASFVSRCGDTLPIVVFGALVAAGCALPRRWRAAAFVPLALVIEVSTFGAVNHLVRRPRPDVETVGSVPSTFSYPSGHVAATLVCWFGLALLLRISGHFRLAGIVAVVAGVATALMGWARVYLGMHHVLDVAFGVLMGLGALSIAASALRLRGEHERATTRH